MLDSKFILPEETSTSGSRLIWGWDKLYRFGLAMSSPSFGSEL